MAQAQIEARQVLESKVQERTEALDRLAKTDALTELLNRRGMSERIAAEVSRSRRENGRVGLLWLDIDLFKEINDVHGHAMGDEALREVASLLLSLLRPYDSVARWGGDEYLVLTQSSTAEELHVLGERIRRAVAESRHLKDAKGVPLTLSVSVGGYLGEAGEDMETLQRADQALYDAKSAGRNCYRAYAG